MRVLVLLWAVVFALRAETGSFAIYSILHFAGEERYEITGSPTGLTLRTTVQIADRGNSRTTTATLQMAGDSMPSRLEIQAAKNTVFTNDGQRFTIAGASPFAVQQALIRYWKLHGRPASIYPARTEPGPEPIHIEPLGHDTITVNGKAYELERYNIANLMFGREILWMTPSGNLVAAMTFAGGLPMEAVRSEFKDALPQLYQMGVAQEMANLKTLARRVAPEQTGNYVIAGARLVDATGAPPVEDSVVVIRNGRIAAVGARGKTRIPSGLPVINAKGKTLLPGLWEMHTHYSGVEFGPASLAAGLTTVRDCGGEFDFLVAQRDASARNSVPAPRLLLAGLVDAGGSKAFGHVTAETPEEGRAVVAKYHAAGFQQMKLYTFLKPDVIRAISTEAHRLGMTVTGHVPQAVTTFEGIEAGMDQLNHLQYATRMFREPNATPQSPIDFGSDTAKRAMQFLKDHHTVVDPTASWGEMASHSKEVDVARFEPGIEQAPFVLNMKFRGMGGDTTAAQMKSRLAQNLAVIGALHKAGVPIIPGSDTGLIGWGLIRELELYVEAGMTPMEAIEAGTVVSARAMGLAQESGTIEAGKRADLILVDGNPVERISDLRKTVKVITAGRMYDTAKLWESVGFHPNIVKP